MNCPKCNNIVNDKDNFCLVCGTDLKNIIGSNISINNKKNKSKRDLIIIISVLLVLIIGVVLFFVFKKDNKDSIYDEHISSDLRVLTTADKLKSDYDNGKIDVNKYFSELVYSEYYSEKLDKNYGSDSNLDADGSHDLLESLLYQFEDQIDDEIEKLYLANASLSNVILGNDDSAAQQSNNKKYNVSFMADNEQANIVVHKLDKAALSKNGNFLVWYTDSGVDGVSLEFINQITLNLEDTISKYEEIFGIKYSYEPYVDNKIFNDDFKNAKKVLEDNNISVDALKTAMSVYIFDTGSSVTLGTYFDRAEAAKIVSRSIIFDVLDNDGAVNYPYMVLNKGKYDESKESFEQVYKHELFHHFQYLYCTEETGDRCLDSRYSEATANLASSLVVDSIGKGSFLSNWGEVFIDELEKDFSLTTDGYEKFPYFYIYSTHVDNWASVITKALTQVDSFKYISDNTKKDDLINISGDLSSRIVANELNFPIDKFDVMELSDGVNMINAGSILFYDLDGIKEVNLANNNNNYLGFRLLGKNKDNYVDILSSTKKLDVIFSDYSNYEKLYLAVYNGDIVNSTSFIVNFSVDEERQDSVEDDITFNTTFDNYNMEIEMNLTVSGINTKTVSKGVMDEKHQIQYLNTEITSMGMSLLNTEIYTDYASGFSYTSQPLVKDVWIKDEANSQLIDLDNMLEQLKSMTNVTKISDNHFKVQITKDDISGLLSSSNADISLINGDIYADVYTENNYIVKLEYDFTNVINGFDLFTATVKFSNYNNAGDVVIPSGVINNAQ